MNKTFKIGECALGGIIRVQTTKHHIKIETIDYYEKNVILTGYWGRHDKYGLNNYLNELTTSYYADMITNYIFKN